MIDSQNKLVKSYDFTFGFCIPNSTNSWEAIYDVPAYSDSKIAEYVSDLHVAWPGPAHLLSGRMLHTCSACCLRSMALGVPSPCSMTQAASHCNPWACAVCHRP